MFDIAWCDKYDLSVLYLYSTLQIVQFQENICRTYFYKKRNICHFLYNHQNVTIFEDEIVNNKAFEYANLIFTEPWELENELMLKIMQNFKFDFLKNEFQADWGVRFKFHFQNLT